MKKSSLISILIVSAIVLTAGAMYAVDRIIPSKNYITRSLEDVKHFDAISVIGTPDVIYTQKEGAPSVSVYCPENIYELLDISTENNTLTVKFKKKVSIVGGCKIKITASSSELKKASITGTGDIDLKGKINSEDIDIYMRGTGGIEADQIVCDKFNSNMSGTGDLEIKSLNCDIASIIMSGTGDVGLKDIACRCVSISISGTGDVKLKGKAEHASYAVSGTGDISAKTLIAQHTVAVASGTGDIECYASESLKAKASGIADIIYYGNPKSVTKEGRSKNIIAK